MISGTWCPQSVLATLAQTGVMNDSTSSRLTHYPESFPSLCSLHSPKLGLWRSQPLRADTLSGEIPQSVLATLAQTGVVENSTPSGLTHKQSQQIAVVDVGQQGPIPVPVHQRTITEHQFLTHPNCGDARSSVRKRGQTTNIHCSVRALCRPRTQRTINEHQFLTHPNSRDARSSVRSSE